MKVFADATKLRKAEKVLSNLEKTLLKSLILEKNLD